MTDNLLIIDTQEKAYILGLYYADGISGQNSISLMKFDKIRNGNRAAVARIAQVTSVRSKNAKKAG